MKKIILSLLVVSMITSCSNNSPNDPGGIWVFKQVNYLGSKCVGSKTAFNLVATGASSANVASTVTVNFYNALPNINGSYTIAGSSNPSQQSQVGIVATVGTSTYTSTYQNTDTVYATISGSTIALSGSGIILKNNSNPSDSSTLYINLNQTQ